MMSIIRINPEYFVEAVSPMPSLPYQDGAY
jgi:hypothetical protein